MSVILAFPRDANNHADGKVQNGKSLLERRCV